MASTVSHQTVRREKEELVTSLLNTLFAASRERHWHGQVGVLFEVRGGQIGEIKKVDTQTFK